MKVQQVFGVVHIQIDLKYNYQQVTAENERLRERFRRLRGSDD